MSVPDEFENWEIKAIFEDGPCRGCSDCAGSDHHWLESSIDPSDTQSVTQWFEDHRQMSGSTAESLLLAHFECKHCPAVAEIE